MTHAEPPYFQKFAAAVPRLSHVRFAQPACSVVVGRMPVPGGDSYVKQRINDREWLVWFRDAMNVGTDTITINAL